LAERKEQGAPLDKLLPYFRHAARNSVWQCRRFQCQFKALGGAFAALETILQRDG
jgi:hypothetical protein